MKSQSSNVLQYMNCQQVCDPFIELHHGAVSPHAPSGAVGQSWGGNCPLHGPKLFPPIKLAVPLFRYLGTCDHPARHVTTNNATIAEMRITTSVRANRTAIAATPPPVSRHRSLEDTFGVLHQALDTVVGTDEAIPQLL
jgi:hypothetical protein